MVVITERQGPVKQNSECNDSLERGKRKTPCPTVRLEIFTLLSWCFISLPMCYLGSI